MRGSQMFEGSRLMLSRRGGWGLAAIIFAEMVAAHGFNAPSLAFAPASGLIGVGGRCSIARISRSFSRSCFAVGSLRAHARAEKESLPSQAVWSSRRGLLTRVTTSSIASALLHTTAGLASADNGAEWMAKPDDAYQKARLQLAKEADAAALLVTPDVREAYRRDGVAVVRGAVEKHWIESLRQGCEVAQVHKCALHGLNCNSARECRVTCTCTV